MSENTLSTIYLHSYIYRTSFSYDVDEFEQLVLGVARGEVSKEYIIEYFNNRYLIAQGAIDK